MVDKTQDNSAAMKKTILCLHGAGSSAAIYRFQSAKLRYELRHHFNFIFVDAPIPSSPGPGMLPVFEGAGPFYVWFSQTNDGRQEEVKAVNERIQIAINENKLSNFGRAPEIVGIMAFSQGCIAATLLLLQQAHGQASWLPKLHFATFICSDFSAEAESYVNATWEGIGVPDIHVKVPTVHIQGRYDPFLQRSREMLATHYSQSKTTKLQFDGAHHFPVTAEDIRKASKLISDAYEGARTG